MGRPISDFAARRGAAVRVATTGCDRRGSRITQNYFLLDASLASIDKQIGGRR